LGFPGEARATASAAQTYWEQTNDLFGMSYSLTALAFIAHAEGQLVEARELYRQILEVNRELGFRRGIQEDLNDLGTISLALGEATAAESYFLEGLRVS